MKHKFKNKAKELDMSISVCSKHMTAMICQACVEEYLKKVKK